jgi:ABC-type amino acid transport substrate-binding protein
MFIFPVQSKEPLMRCLSLLLALVLVGVPQLGCKDDGGTSAEGGKKVIVVGTEPTFPPFEYVDSGGEVAGFDVDLVKAIGAKAGFEVQVQRLGFDALIPALQAGQIDIAASGMSITDERKQSVAFSDPYIDAGLVLAVRQDEQAIKGTADLQGKTVAVQRGSTGAEAADKLKEEGKVAKVTYFATVPLAMMELMQGGADAVINDKPVSEIFVARQPGKLRLLEEPIKSDSYGLAMRKGNDQLVQQVNKALAELKAEGKLEDLKRKHFAASADAATTQPASTQPAN